MSDNNPQDWTSLDYGAMWEMRRKARRSALAKKPSKKSFDQYWSDYESELADIGYQPVLRDRTKPGILGQILSDMDEAARRTEEERRDLEESRERAQQQREEEEALQNASIAELLSRLGMSLADLEENAPMSGSGPSTRVASMQFLINEPGRQMLIDIVRGSMSRQFVNTVSGDIYVTWVNGKTPWRYRDRTMADFDMFKNSPSKGKHINQYLTSNHGPA